MSLSDTKLKDIGKDLDRLILKKEYLSFERDYTKAVLFFYRLYCKGIVLTNDELRRAIKLAKSTFSDNTIKEMGYFADTFYLLKEGLE